jgi:tetratricopeptide (TPR) repeat protein
MKRRIPTRFAARTLRLVFAIAVVASEMAVAETKDKHPNSKDTGGQSASVSQLWDELNSARSFSFDTPLRNPTVWRAMNVLRAAEQIVERFPGGLDEARARLWLAHLGESQWTQSNRARYHVILAQRILERLMRERPDMPGLATAVADAAFSPTVGLDGDAPYHQSAVRYLRSRWEAGGEDAAEAAYCLGMLLNWSSSFSDTTNERRERETLYEDLATKYPDSEWAFRARLRLPRVYHYKTVGRLLELADQYRGDASHREMLVDAALRTNFHLMQHGALRERLESSLKIIRKRERDYPHSDSRTWFPTGLPYSIAYEPWPSFYVPRNERINDTAHIRELVQKYLLSDPLGLMLGTVSFLAERDGVGMHKDPQGYREYCKIFWQQLEDTATAAQKPGALVARGMFMGPYSTADVEDARATLERLVRDFPRDRWTPVAMDALAQLAQNAKQPEQAEQWWRKLRDGFPEHPLSRLGFFELDQLDCERRSASERRDALAELEKQLPRDAVVPMLAAWHRGQTYLVEKRHDSADAEYQRLAKLPEQFFHTWWAAGGQEFKKAATSSTWNALQDRPDFDRWPTLMWQTRPQPSGPRDAHLEQVHLAEDNAAKLRAYRQYMAAVSGDPRFTSYYWQNFLKLLLSLREYDEARVWCDKWIALCRDEPMIVCQLKITLLKLDYLKRGLSVKPIDKQTAVARLHQILRDYVTALSSDVAKRDILDKEMISWLTDSWKSQIEEQLTHHGYSTPLTKWLCFSGDHPTTTLAYELVDGKRGGVALYPPYEKVLCGTFLDWIADTTGSDGSDDSVFVRDVVGDVFLLNDKRKLDSLPLPVPVRKIVFYDPDRTRIAATVDREPQRRDPPRRTIRSDCFPSRRDELWERRDGELVRSEGRGWFR